MMPSPRVLYSILLASSLALHSVVAKVTRRYNLTVTYQWSNGDGHGRPAYMINGMTPGPLIEADEGDEIEVFLDNQLTAETTMHWLVEHSMPWN